MNEENFLNLLAERAAYKADLDIARAFLKQLQSENTNLQAKLDLAVEALKFYADTGGGRARQALAKIKELEK